MKKLLLSLIILTAGEFALAQTQAVYRWAGKIAGTGNEYAEYLKCDNAGNITVSGRFDGTCDFDPGTGSLPKTSAGSSDCFIAKYDKNGTPIWLATFGGTGLDRINAHTIDNAGNIYVAGYFASTVDFDPGPGTNSITATTGTDMFISKFSSNGTYQWTKAYGANGTDYAWNVACDGSGNVYMVGEFTSDSITFDPLNSASTLVNFAPTTTTYDGFLLKLDSLGQYQWAKNMQGTASDYLRSVNITSGGDIIVGGYFNTGINLDPSNPINSLGLADCYIARFQADGTFNWISRFGGASTDNLFSAAISGSDIVVNGIFNGIADFDPGAGTTSLTSNGSADVFLAKYNATTGALVWAKGFGRNGSETSNAVDVNSAGEIYVAGSFIDSTKLDPSGVAPSIISYDGRDGFIAKYDANGTYIYGARLGSIVTDYSRAIATDPTSDDIWVSGYFGSGNFYPDPTNQSVTFSNSGANDAFFGRYGACSFPVINTQPANSGACAGGSTSFNIAGTGSNITYQWQIGLNGGIIWSNLQDTGIFSGTSTAALAINGVGSNLNSSFYRCIISADCGLSTTSGVCILFVSSPNTTVNQNQHILTAVQGGNATYQWLDCNNGNAPISGATTQQYIPSQPGSYAVQVTLNGCTATSTCYNVTVIGLQDLTADGSSIYPIPAHDQLNINMSTSGDYRAFIYDLSGKTVLQSSLPFSRKTQLDIAGIEKGTYLLGVRDAEGRERFTRIVIQ